MLSKSSAIKEFRKTVTSMKGIFLTRDISAILMIMGKIQREKYLIMHEVDAEVMSLCRSEGIRSSV